MTAEARKTIRELCDIIDAFLGSDEKMTPMIGGNPNYVENFLAQAREAVEKARKAAE